MASQLFESSNLSASDQDSSRSISDSEVSEQRSQLVEMMRSMYQADHQVEYLHLRAETELLLQQLQTLKQQRLTIPVNSDAPAL